MLLQIITMVHLPCSQAFLNCFAKAVNLSKMLIIVEIADDLDY